MTTFETASLIISIAAAAAATAAALVYRAQLNEMKPARAQSERQFNISPGLGQIDKGQEVTARWFDFYFRISNGIDRAARGADVRFYKVHVRDGLAPALNGPLLLVYFLGPDDVNRSASSAAPKKRSG